MCDSKIINSKCVCNNHFINSNKIVVSLVPCEHLVHLDCIDNLVKCPICNTNIIKHVNLKDYENDYKCTQQCIDILSVTAEKIHNTDMGNCLLSLPNLLEIAPRFIFAKTQNDYRHVISSILSLINYSVKIKGLKKIQNLEKKIFISNHVGNIDTFILYYFLKCGFLAAAGQKESPMSVTENVIPVVYVKRGQKSNTVKKIKDFVDKHGSICIFPEGTVSRMGTLLRFRSGAFNIGYPIYPVILKYKDYSFACSGCDILQVALQYCSHTNTKMEIEVEILDPIYPPFNKNTPEQIRQKMASNGNFVMSRVMANDIKD
jgi:1-acyl-sn-glycerol-3-phosphate acyltransferase